MSAKKTFSNWLTTKYLLIVRNEENFAEKTTYTFNYARLILLAVFLFLVAVVLAIVLVRGILHQRLDPRYTEQQTKRQLINMRLEMDSLEYQILNQNAYIENIRTILTGDYNVDQIDSLSENEVRPEVVLEERLQPLDSQFREQFESGSFSELPFVDASSVNEFRSIYLFSPVDGIVSDQFDPKQDHYGIDLVARENEPVKSVADGIVIFSSWTLDGGHAVAVQHKGGLVSVYKHNSELLKNVGNFVTGGEIIAIIGNSGEQTTGPHLHFELWHDGTPVNPEEYIGF